LESSGEDIVTWGEFTETRLLSEFRGAGVPMVRMRPTVERLREMFKKRYPLAYARPWLEPKGREIVLRAQEATELDKHLLLVVVRNHQLLLTEEATNFVSSAEFDADGGPVRRIRPVALLDRVWLDPLRQFGEPVVRSVPTAVIAEQFRAGDSMDFIASTYELAAEDVDQAIRYELIRANAQEAA
jgi:uncharacterized protein (DUF433 family)